MKTYAAVIACLTLAGASAVHATEDAIHNDTALNNSTMEQHPQNPPATLNADDIEGKDVVDMAGRELGDIDEVVYDSTNRVMAVIGLEDSAKEVAIPLDSLSMTDDGTTLISSLSRDQLDALPDYDPMDMESVEE